MEPVSAFEGTKRSCIVKLEIHNNVRRDRFRAPTRQLRRPKASTKEEGSPSAQDASTSTREASPAAAADSASVQTPEGSLQELLSMWMQSDQSSMHAPLELELWEVPSAAAPPPAHASPPRLSLHAPSSLSYSLHVPDVPPGQLPWGPEGARAAASSALFAGLGWEDGLGIAASLEGHIRPGCTLLTVDALLFPPQPSSERPLSASAALQSLLSGAAPLASFLRAQPRLSLQMERGGCTRDAAVSISGRVTRSAEAAAAAGKAHCWLLPCALDPRAPHPLRLLPSSAEYAADEAPHGRLHGQSVVLQRAGAQGYSLPPLPPSAAGALLVSFASPLSPTASTTAPLLLCEDARVLAEVNATCVALLEGAAPPSPAEQDRLRAALIAVAHALRGADHCSPELAAAAWVSAAQQGWRATAALILASLCRNGDDATLIRVPSAGGASLVHAAVLSGEVWALEAVLEAAAGSPRLGGAATPSPHPHQRTPLHLAAHLASAPLIAALTRGAEGLAGWHLARDGGGATAGEVLLSHRKGVDPALTALVGELERRGRAGDALMRAAMEAERADGTFVVELLLEKGLALVSEAQPGIDAETRAAAVAFFRAHSALRAAASGVWFSRRQTADLYYTDNNWSAAPYTLLLTIFLLVAQRWPRLRRAYARHQTLILAPHWIVLFIINAVRMGLYLLSQHGEAIAVYGPPRLGSFSSIILITFTVHASTSPLETRTLCALLLLRLGISLALAPSGVWGFGGSLLGGEDPFGVPFLEHKLVQTALTLGAVAFLWRRDARKFESWRSARVKEKAA